MSESWYYVLKGQRQGPVDASAIASLVSSQQLRPDDYIWKKGFDNWRKLKDVEELQSQSSAPSMPSIPQPPVKQAATHSNKLRMGSLDPEEKSVYVRIGVDRGGSPAEYGPYTPLLVKKLYEENRVNGRTQFFVREKMQEWMFLADLADFEEVFHDMPPVIQETERRRWIRKPLLARLFVQNHKKVFEGICRDISVGGMQVLTDTFPGKAGDKISINVHPDNTEYHFTAAGTVVRLLEGNQGFSFRFDPLQNDAQRAIEKYIKDVDATL
ncbi:MAG: GYF domain-containing protein [Bacteriovoracaceae bacterium]|nr:GYF domain-containing protein [Bacteriovoracaceae bacterium]